MKKILLLISIMLFTTYCFASAKYETTLKAKVTFHKINGKTKRLLRTLIKVEHYLDASILNLLNPDKEERGQDCQYRLDSGILSALVFIRPVEDTCINNSERMVVSKKMLRDILIESITSSIQPLATGELFDKACSYTNAGNIKKLGSNDDNYLVKKLRNLSHLFTQFYDITTIRLSEKTSFEVYSSDSAEKFVIEIGPVKRRML